MQPTTPLALVIGANRGIGLEVCRQLGQNCMRMLLGARDPAKGKVAADTLAREGIVVQTVIHGRDGCGERQRRCRASRFDQVLVNNAGVDYDTDQTALAADLVRVRRILETNLLGAWIVAGAFAPGMRERGWGRIVNVSSGAGSLAEMRRVISTAKSTGRLAYQQ